MLYLTPHCCDRLSERQIDASSVESVATSPFLSVRLDTGRRARIGPGRDHRGYPIWVLVIVDGAADDVGITTWRPRSLPRSARGLGRTRGPARPRAHPTSDATAA